MFLFDYTRGALHSYLACFKRHVIFDNMALCRVALFAFYIHCMENDMVATVKYTRCRCFKNLLFTMNGSRIKKKEAQLNCRLCTQTLHSYKATATLS